jgi:hypothetical protein
MLFTIIGLGLFVLALYVLIADWGSLADGFFLGSGITILFIGFIVFFMSILGCFGLAYQVRREGLCVNATKDYIL